jgi:hypothetical protein
MSFRAGFSSSLSARFDGRPLLLFCSIGSLLCEHARTLARKPPFGCSFVLYKEVHARCTPLGCLPMTSACLAMNPEAADQHCTQLTDISKVPVSIARLYGNCCTVHTCPGMRSSLIFPLRVLFSVQTRNRSETRWHFFASLPRSWLCSTLPALSNCRHARATWSPMAGLRRTQTPQGELVAQTHFSVRARRHIFALCCLVCPCSCYVNRRMVHTHHICALGSDCFQASPHEHDN